MKAQLPVCNLSKILAVSLGCLMVPAAFADTAQSLAEAMDVPTNDIVSASFTVLAHADAAKVRANWGVTSPFSGTNLAALSSGRAATLSHPGYVAPSPGTTFGTSTGSPVAGQTNCGGSVVEGSTAYDYTELELVLQAPTNAAGFRLTFNFFSADYPEWVCSQFNDRFLLRLTSAAFDGNIAFDTNGFVVSLNTASFPVTSGGELVGTGMDGGVGAAIGWQTAEAPVFNGETFTLRFIIYDGGDGAGDSVAVIDSFEWIEGTNEPVLVTVPTTIHHAVELLWSTEAGKNYQVEWASALDTNLWTALGPVVAGTGTNHSAFDSTRFDTNRFYRVRQLPW